MVIKRVWIEEADCGGWGSRREGWFLFGIIPLYVRDMEPRRRKR
jgi:hypothetical protein